MKRILSTTFISCSHGEIRFLRSKKNKNRKQQRNRFSESTPIDSRTRNRNRTRFQKFRNLTALVNNHNRKFPPAQHELTDKSHQERRDLRQNSQSSAGHTQSRCCAEF